LRSSKGTHKGSPAKSRDNRRDFPGGDAPAKRMRRSRYLERMAGGPEPLPRTPMREGNGRHLQRRPRGNPRVSPKTVGTTQKMEQGDPTTHTPKKLENRNQPTNVVSCRKRTEKKKTTTMLRIEHLSLRHHARALLSASRGNRATAGDEIGRRSYRDSPDLRTHNRTVLWGTVQLQSNVLAPCGLSDLPHRWSRTEEQHHCSVGTGMHLSQ